MSKPFKRPLKWQAWRLLTNDNTTKKAEIIVGPNDTLVSYAIRYIKRRLKTRLRAWGIMSL